MAGKLTVNPVQMGDSSTATNNFVLKTDNAGGIKLSRGNDGATTQDVLSVDASGNLNANVALQQGGIATPRMVLETAQSTTSGTSKDFTSIPSWVKKITVMLNGVSTNGASIIMVQIGDAGGIENTGYAGGGTIIVSATPATTGQSTGFPINGGQDAGQVIQGSMTLTTMGSNIWTAFGAFGRSDIQAVGVMGGSKTLSATLDRIRLTTVNGTDTFDAGSVNILYEG